MDPNTIVTSLMNLGVGGLMAGFLVMMHWQMVKTTLPQIIADFKEEMKAEREAHSKHIDAIVGRLEGVEKDVASLVAFNVRKQ